jgi:uracil-DNA glycosylase
VVALGKIGFDAMLAYFRTRGLQLRPKPAFGHACEVALPAEAAVGGAAVLLGSYHPSRQNTNTGKLDASMMDEVFVRAARALRYT